MNVGGKVYGIRTVSGGGAARHGENVSIWPFVLLGVGILLIAALVVLQIASKKKGGPKNGPSGPDQQSPQNPEQK